MTTMSTHVQTLKHVLRQSIYSIPPQTSDVCEAIYSERRVIHTNAVRCRQRKSAITRGINHVFDSSTQRIEQMLRLDAANTQIVDAGKDLRRTIRPTTCAQKKSNATRLNCAPVTSIDRLLSCLLLCNPTYIRAHFLALTVIQLAAILTAVAAFLRQQLHIANVSIL
jgi:hypothetical protein